MKQYILYLNLPDSYCQIFLPTENNRKYELELSAQLPIPPCKLELELLDGHWWLLQNAQIRPGLHAAVRPDAGLRPSWRGPKKILGMDPGNLGP